VHYVFLIDGLVSAAGEIMHEEMTKEQLLNELKEMRQELQSLDSCRQEMQSVQRKYDRLLQSTPDAMLFVGRNARIVLANQQVEKLFGYSNEELVGKDLHVLIPERFRGRHRNNVASYFSDPRTRPMGTRLQIYGLRKDGAEFPADISLSPLEAEGGLLVIAAIRDITDRKRAEREAAEGQKLRLAQEVARIGTYEWDIQTDVMRWTPEMEALYGLQPGGFGKTYAEWVTLVHPEDRPEAEEAMRNAIQQGVFETEFRAVWPNGTLRWLAARGVVFKNGDGKPRRLVGVNIDITERRKTEEDMARLLSELQRSNKELEQFAYIASHDLQEPLRMIASYVQLLEQKYKGRLDEKADKYIYFAVDGALRMQNLIEALLAYSRVTTRGAPFDPVDTNLVFTHVVVNLSAVIKENHAVVTKDPLPTVRGDEAQLAQLFQNLIGNAIKFRKPDTPPLVHVSAKKARKQWAFSVRDNGIGMEAKYFDRIFQIFQRLHTHAEYPGTGIGLAICKRIVERHGGRIWLESAPGEGTTFFFTLATTGEDNDTRGR
jgi:PAS domain S-box-containing protein